MPPIPIPIHKNDPIHPTAAKPTGTIPQTANPPPTRTTPASVPPSTTATASSPPPPQPGARPPAPTAPSAHTTTSSSPPAPQPSYTATKIATETRLGGPPAQFHVPPPTDSRLAGRSTTTSTQPSKTGPTTLNLGPVQSQYQSEHTGGAVDVGGSERRSFEHPPGYAQAPDHTPYSTAETQNGESAEGVGGAAWNMLSKAGEALKKGEEAAWRAVRNK